ncbi:TolB family protein [Nonomuraea sp. NPDC048826]|uniref:TolB family protein n=1 Tax=Nonomuraea sp. NPDC048826 TaxID=3364347 RepID=UPI0037193A99
MKLVTVLAAAALVTTAAPAAQAAERPRPVSGAAVYAHHDGAYRIDRHRPGSGWRPLAVLKDSVQFAASPDGRKVAYITGTTLRVRAGGKVTTVARGVQSGVPCLSPVWSPDSERIAYLVGSKVRVTGADGGGSRVLGKTRGPCHLAWSPDGRYVAGYAGTTEGVYRLDLKTGRSVKVKGVKLANHVQSLSPGGRYAVVDTLRADEPGGDGSWPRWFTPTVVDTVTGRRVSLPVRGRAIGAFYLADGRLVVRISGKPANTWAVLDRRGRVTQRLTEPSAARERSLLQVL